MAKLCHFLLALACVAFMTGLVLLCCRYPVVFLVLLALAAWKRMGRREVTTAHGSASMATLATLMRARMIGREKGWIMGRASLLEPPPRIRALAGLVFPFGGSDAACRSAIASLRGQADERLIRVPDGVHALTCAPSGAGKSVSTIVPNLLSLEDSCVTIDPKGELFRLTAEHRRRKFGHKIIRFDPFGVAGPATTSDCLNPLLFIDDTKPDFIDECRAVADLLVLVTGKETDPYWNARALDVITAFVAFVCACEKNPEHRTLTVVRDLLVSPDRFREAVKAMKASSHADGMVALLGNSLDWLQDRELNSVISTVSRHIAFLQSPVVCGCLNACTFDPNWLKAGRMTVYVILPHNKLTILAPLIRLILGTLLRVASGHTASEHRKVLFIVDECAALGNMRPIVEAVTLLRGYGIRLWLFFQSLDQVKQCYGEAAGVILDNISTQQYFGISSLDTADHLSKRMGDSTILVQSLNNNASRSRSAGGSGQGDQGSVSNGFGTTLSEQARRLIKPEEILLLPAHVGLVFHKNLPVIPVELIKYFNAPEFARGGIGRDRRMSVRAVLGAACLLAYSVVFLSVMTVLPAPAPMPRPAPARVVGKTGVTPLRRPVSHVRAFRR